MTAQDARRLLGHSLSEDGAGHPRISAAVSAKGRISAVLLPGPPLASSRSSLAERGGSRLNSAAQASFLARPGISRRRSPRTH